MTPLHHLGDTLRDLLSAVPLPLVRALFVALPLAVLIWVLTLPTENTTPRKKQVHWSENLKVWAIVALVIQVGIYACL